MKRLIFSMLLTLLAFGAGAQVRLFKGSLQEALDKAGQENKHVMVIGSTTWCGPCKYLTNVLLQDKETSAYMDPRFIVKKYYLDIDSSDNIAARFGIAAYPTMVILNAAGEEVNRILGGGANVKEFLEKVRQALLPENTFQARDRRLEQDPGYALEYADYLAEKCRMGYKAGEMLGRLFGQPLEKGLCTEDAFRLYDLITPSCNSPFLQVLIGKEKEISALTGKDRYQRWMQAKGDHFIQYVFYEKRGRKKKLDKVLDFVGSHPVLQGKLYRTVSRHREDFTASAFNDRLAAFGKEILKTRDSRTRSSLLSMLFKTASDETQKEYREDIILLYEKLARKERSPQQKKRYLNMVEKLENLDD